MRTRYGQPPIRPFRRVETPPGAQTQSDWGEFRWVDRGDNDGPVVVYAFIMVLSHSRMEAAAVLISYQRHTQERILIDPACYEGPGTAEVAR